MMRRSSWAMATWYFGTKSSGWVAMDAKASAKLDDAVQQGLRTTSFRIGGQSYSFDLSANLQTNESSKTQRPISNQGPSGHASPTLPASTAPPAAKAAAQAANAGSGTPPSPSTTPDPSAGITTSGMQTASSSATHATAPTQSESDKLAKLKRLAAYYRAQLTWDGAQVGPRRYAVLTKHAFGKHIDRLTEAYAADIRYRAAKEVALRKELKQARLALKSAKRNRSRLN